MCVHCLRVGKLNIGPPTNHVDHIIRPESPDDPLFNDPLNHQTLCRTHHKKKTELEDAGQYNAAQDRAERQAAIAECRRLRREGG